MLRNAIGGLEFVQEIGFEYSLSEIFERSNNYEYYSRSCFIKQSSVLSTIN